MRSLRLWKAVPVAWREALPPFVTAKLLTLLIGFLTIYSRSQSTRFPSGDDLAAPFSYWDAKEYATVAVQGYPAGPLDLVPGHPGHLWVYFPGYPIMIRWLYAFLGNPILSGVLVTALCEFIAMVYLYRWIEIERDRESARFACWLFPLVPLAVFFTAAYSETPFLAAAIASIYYARRDNFRAASFAAAIAMAVRITGLALLPALLIEFLVRRHRRLGRELIWILLSIAPIVAFVLYARLQTGDALAYLHVEASASYTKHTAWPWTGFISVVHNFFGVGKASDQFIWLRELVAVLISTGLLVVMWIRRRSYPLSVCIYSTGVWILATTPSYWSSVARYFLVMFPGLLVLCDLTRSRPNMQRFLLTTSAVLMAFFTSYFVMGPYLE